MESIARIVSTTPDIQTRVNCLMFDMEDASFSDPIIATHDTELHDYTIRKAEGVGWKSDEYEVEMLLGVREKVARDLARKDQRVRCGSTCHSCGMCRHISNIHSR